MTALDWDRARRRQTNRLRGDTPWHPITAQTNGTCSHCYKPIWRGTPAYWNADTRTLTHPHCHQTTT